MNSPYGYTRLEPLDGRLVAREIDGRGELKEKGVEPLRWRVVAVEPSSASDFLNHIANLEINTAIVRGKVGVIEGSEVSSLNNLLLEKRRWVCFDASNIPTISDDKTYTANEIIAYVMGLLPPAFADASYVARFAGSSGFRNDNTCLLYTSDAADE